MTHIFHMSQVFSEIEPLTVNTLALFILVHLVHLTTLGNFRNHSSACKKKIKCSENFRCFITNSLVKGISTILMHSALDSEVLLLFFFFFFADIFALFLFWFSVSILYTCTFYKSKVHISIYIHSKCAYNFVNYIHWDPERFLFFFFLPKSTS